MGVSTAGEWGGVVAAPHGDDGMDTSLSLASSACLAEGVGIFGDSNEAPGLNAGVLGADTRRSMGENASLAGGGPRRSSSSTDSTKASMGRAPGNASRGKINRAGLDNNHANDSMGAQTSTAHHDRVVSARGVPRARGETHSMCVRPTRRVGIGQALSPLAPERPPPRTGPPHRPRVRRGGQAPPRDLGEESGASISSRRVSAR